MMRPRPPQPYRDNEIKQMEYSFFPGPWQKSGYGLQDTLKLLSIPFATISVGEKAEVLQGLHNIYEADLYKAGEIALTHLSDLI